MPSPPFGFPRVYFSGDWDVHWGYGLLRHGHICPFYAGGQVEHLTLLGDFEHHLLGAVRFLAGVMVLRGSVGNPVSPLVDQAPFLAPLDKIRLGWMNP